MAPILYLFSEINVNIDTMTIWTPDLEERDGPRYRAIADAIAEDIARGVLAEGFRLPPHRKLAYALGVTVGTVTRAYREAERRGLVSGEVGRGTFVRSDSEGRFRSPLVVPETQAPGEVDMGRNFTPDADLDTILAETLTDLSKERGLSTLMHYQPAAGMVRHREAGARWIVRSGLAAARPEQTLITVGAQHGISLALMALTRPGDTVMTESLTYPGALSLAGIHGVRLQGLAMDEEGLLPDALEAACRSGNSRVLYFTPTYHNPTGAVMSDQRRRDIGAIVETYAITAIEDDIFGWLRPDVLPPVAASAPGRVCYLSGFKYAPGLRIGFLHAPEALLSQLTSVLRSTLWMAPPLSAEIAAHWINEGTAERLTVWHRREAATRQRLFQDVMGDFEYRLEKGAYHAWLHLPAPWLCDDFSSAAEARGVLVMPASTFAVGRTNIPHSVRISLGCPPTRNDLQKGLARLVALLNEQPAAAPVI